MKTFTFKPVVKEVGCKDLLYGTFFRWKEDDYSILLKLQNKNYTYIKGRGGVVGYTYSENTTTPCLVCDINGNLIGSVPYKDIGVGGYFVLESSLYQKTSRSIHRKILGEHNLIYVDNETLVTPYELGE